MAIAPNCISQGRQGKELRQEASLSQLKELIDVQRNLAFTVEMGYISLFKSSGRTQEVKPEKTAAKLVLNPNKTINL